jgi:ribosomal protein S27AE
MRAPKEKSKSLKNSGRAKKGKIEIVERFCERCGHTRAINNYRYFKCTRCGYRYDG